MPDIHEVVRRICLHFPETTEVISHGTPDFRVRNKSFASFTVNHHGDGKLALLLNASIDTQTLLIDAAPTIFFVPPYVGPKGWYGIDLAAGMRWERVAELTRDAYARVAPKLLAASAQPPVMVPTPDTLDIRKIDPFFAPASQALLKRLRAICLAMPEVEESTSFGSPVFRAGKKTFCQFGMANKVPSAYFWVGPEQQASFTLDQRFDVPPYMGHNGWIRLKLDARFDAAEITQLAIASYRHFALKRMLAKLDPSTVQQGTSK